MEQIEHAMEHGDPDSDNNNPVVPRSLTRYEQTADRIAHRAGLLWRYAPIPQRWHRCRPWSTLYTPTDLIDAERCACGGIRFDGYGPWIERNTRRHRKPTW